MTRPSISPFLRYAVAALALAALSPVAAAHAQTDASGRTVAGVTHSHKAKRKGTANQPAPTEHQAVPPSQRLQDEPNQVKEQVAPMPAAPVKPGTTAPADQGTPKPQRR